MNLFELWMSSSIADAVGRTVLYSLAEGGCVALGLSILSPMIRSVALRYVAACCALITLPVLAIATLAYEYGDLAAIPTYPVSVVAPQGMKLFPYLSLFWIAGALLFSGIQLLRLVGSRRLRTRGVCSAPERWQLQLDAIRGLLNVPRPVVLLESCLAKVPVVLGHLRPVIVLPLGVLTGMPPEHVDLILMHELAHIRRSDYLINLLQCVIESLMFYNPAGWWISHVVRQEREHCCDDIVVQSGRNRGAYADALIKLESLKEEFPMFGVPSTGGNLKNRISRILFNTEQRQASHGRAIAAVLALTLLLAMTGSPRVHATPVEARSPVAIVMASEIAAIELPPSPTPSLVHAVRSLKPQQSASVAANDAMVWVLIRDDAHGNYFIGNTPFEGRQEANSTYEAKSHPDMLWFRANGKSYLIQDSPTLDRIQALFFDDYIFPVGETLERQVRQIEARQQAQTAEVQAFMQGLRAQLPQDFNSNPSMESMVSAVETESQVAGTGSVFPSIRDLSDVSAGDITTEFVQASANAVAAATKVRQLAEQQLANEKVKFDQGRSTVRFVLEDQYSVAKALTTQRSAIRNLVDAKLRLGIVSTGNIIREALASGLAKPLL